MIRDVLLASASVPGMLPPVAIEVDVDGRRFRELHCDGGATSPVFVPSPVFAAAASPPQAPPEPPGALYVIVAGKLYPDAGAVRQRVLPVLGATANALLYANTRAELTNLFSLAHGAGLDYRVAALRPEFHTVEDSLDFRKPEQTRLLAEGMRLGASANPWMVGPPELMPGDGDFIRTGNRLRTTEPPAP